MPCLSIVILRPSLFIAYPFFPRRGYWQSLRQICFGYQTFELPHGSVATEQPIPHLSRRSACQENIGHATPATCLWRTACEPHTCDWIRSARLMCLQQSGCLDLYEQRRVFVIEHCLQKLYRSRSQWIFIYT